MVLGVAPLEGSSALKEIAAAEPPPRPSASEIDLSEDSPAFNACRAAPVSSDSPLDATSDFATRWATMMWHSKQDGAAWPAIDSPAPTAPMSALLDRILYRDPKNRIGATQLARSSPATSTSMSVSFDGYRRSRTSALECGRKLADRSRGIHGHSKGTHALASQYDILSRITPQIYGVKLPHRFTE